MSNELEVFDDAKEMPEDKWLSDNLSQLTIMPSDTFTQEVIEKLDIKPKQKWDSPIFWILISVPLAFILTGLLFSVKPILDVYNINIGVSFKNYSFLTISKTALLIVLTGVSLIVIDHFINQGVSRKNLYSFLF